ncbi:MAG: hypothetical protein KAI53_00250 [Candidatus Aenigmarchaeota archaeon]|nr:hypothetical protein [Candidatus Aenigmarchaeota archaeon]
MRKVLILFILFGILLNIDTVCAIGISGDGCGDGFTGTDCVVASAQAIDSGTYTFDSLTIQDRLTINGFDPSAIFVVDNLVISGTGEIYLHGTDYGGGGACYINGGIATLTINASAITMT